MTNKNIEDINFFQFGIKLNTISLSDVTYNVPNNSGIYVIYENNKMIKIGQTMHLKNRLEGYYGCKRNDSEINKYITYLNRDNMVIQWMEYDSKSISDMETLLQKLVSLSGVDLLCWKRK
ncbi:hypothetical protein [Clostridium sp.]|uniref:hypothetical protein n=1 Tax=Clostridium sp. TaxID=1506 RepID=UPI001A5EC82B|nr:hypothetical protein [Clostridium sp.]MBK5240555.1 hypothetical protein [Clostridium sp.]